jgi:hypothetical protein
VSATSHELSNGFLVGAYLAQFTGDFWLRDVLALGIGGDWWSEKLVYDLVDQGLLEQPEGGYFFPTTPVKITDSGKLKALEFLDEPGARVPESVFCQWKYNYIDNKDNDPRYGGLKVDDLPPELTGRFVALESAYRHFVNLVQGERTRMQRYETPSNTTYDSSAWTGANRIERIRIIREMVGPIRNIVDGMIAQLEAVGHNGGPPLEDVSEQLDCLRHLHEALGRFLEATATDCGMDVFGGLVAEISNFSSRFAAIDVRPWNVTDLE